MSSFQARTLTHSVCIQQPSFSGSALEQDEQKSPSGPRDPKPRLLLRSSAPCDANSSALRGGGEVCSETQRFALAAHTYCTKAESQIAILDFPSSKCSGAVVLKRTLCFFAQPVSPSWSLYSPPNASGAESSPPALGHVSVSTDLCRGVLVRVPFSFFSSKTRCKKNI